MKLTEKKILMFCLLLFTYQVNSQTILDTKEFLFEKVNSNPPANIYSNYFFFNTNLLKIDTDNGCNRTLSEEEFKNILIYCREYGSFFSIWQSIDIRSMEKISTSRITNSNGSTYITINVYLNNLYKTQKVTHTLIYGSPPENKKYDIKIESLNKMEILISDNYEIANQIKKALINLAKLSGKQVFDMDNMFK